MNLDLNRFNFSEWFGCIDATNTKVMKSNAFKGFRTYLQVKSFEQWSDGQVSYVGDHMDGVDFISTSDETRYEMKSSLGLFNKNGSCKRVILINKRPGKHKITELTKQDIRKTFEYMLLVDTKNMTMGYTDWDTVYSRTECDGAGATFKLLPGDFEVIFQCTKLSKKQITSSEILDSFQKIL